MTARHNRQEVARAKAQATLDYLELTYGEVVDMVDALEGNGDSDDTDRLHEALRKILNDRRPEFAGAHTDSDTEESAAKFVESYGPSEDACPSSKKRGFESIRVSVDVVNLRDVHRDARKGGFQVVSARQLDSALEVTLEGPLDAVVKYLLRAGYEDLVAEALEGFRGFRETRAARGRKGR